MLRSVLGLEGLGICFSALCCPFVCAPRGLKRTAPASPNPGLIPAAVARTPGKNSLTKGTRYGEIYRKLPSSLGMYSS